MKIENNYVGTYTQTNNNFEGTEKEREDHIWAEMGIGTLVRDDRTFAHKSKYTIKCLMLGLIPSFTNTHNSLEHLNEVKTGKLEESLFSHAVEFIQNTDLLGIFPGVEQLQENGFAYAALYLIASTVYFGTCLTVGVGIDLYKNDKQCPRKQINQRMEDDEALSFKDSRQIQETKDAMDI